MLKMILAMDQDNLVGSTTSQNGLAWHYAEDLKYYKEQTLGKINIMGHNTFKAIGRPLPGRTTMILSRNQELEIPGCELINSVEAVLKLAQQEEVIICGGVSVYQQFNKYADTIYLTRINKSHQGDIYYPDLDLSSFSLIDEKGGIDAQIRYQTWERM